eukprot:1486373-Rhodomonas_salina.3
MHLQRKRFLDLPQHLTKLEKKPHHESHKSNRTLKGGVSTRLARAFQNLVPNLRSKSTSTHTCSLLASDNKGCIPPEMTRRQIHFSSPLAAK